jgi:His/Glu/Gln/Arg/opine family amino acid ABC transporter permease subunit
MTVPQVLQGLGVTLELWLGSLALAIILAIPVALGRRSKNRFAYGFASLWVTIARGLPPTVWLFLLFFGVKFGPTATSPVIASIVGLGIVTSAYIGDSIRAGLESVEKGQWEACSALALSRPTTYLRVIGPQALPITLAATAAYAISLLKNTAIASIIGANDLVYYANTAVQLGSDAIVTFLFVGIIYLVFTIPVGFLARTIESRTGIAVSGA